MISGNARLTGLLGWPVSHSKSPALHAFWLKEAGIDGAYLPLKVAAEDLPAVLYAMPRMGFIGANVTVPHKQAVMNLVDHLDPWALQVGAVNLLVWNEQDGLTGFNSDAMGFLLNLKQAFPDFAADRGPAVLLGAGGAARAVAAALVGAGAPEIRLLNRSFDKADDLARQIGGPILPLPWKDRHAALANAALLVNSTSLGMRGQPNLDLNLTDLPGDALVNDLVYAPLETALLAAARRRGNPVVNGIGMLLHQARPAFAAWWGIEPELAKALQEILLAP
jgi:shikimate dehydrogenase